MGGSLYPSFFAGKAFYGENIFNGGGLVRSYLTFMKKMIGLKIAELYKEIQVKEKALDKIHLKFC